MIGRPVGGRGAPPREASWYREPVRSVLEWPGMRSRYARLPPHPDSATTTGPFQVGVSFSGHSGLVREADGHTVSGDIRAGTAFVTGAEPITWLDVAEPTEALEVYPDRELIGGLGEPRVEPAEGVQDGMLFGLVSILKRVHVRGGELTDVGASTLAHKLAWHLGARYLGVSAVDAPEDGALGSGAVERVAGYVRANLGGSIRLDRLAAQVSLSPFHFARAFKAATGLPPHRYVTAVRLEAAKTALVRGRDSVTDVAHAVGFRNVSHFRRLFHRELGVRPGELRAQ